MWPFNLLKPHPKLDQPPMATQVKPPLIEETNDSSQNAAHISMDQISAERNKLSVILSGISDAVIALDLNKNVVTFNNMAEKLFGIKKEEALGKPINFIMNVFEGSIHLSDNTFSPPLKPNFEGVVFTKNNLRILSSANKEFFVNMSTGQILEGAHVNLGSILTLHDITAERQLETMKMDFVSMAAHELRTPLTSIKGYLSVLINEYKDKFNSDQNMLISRISAATTQLTTLVENLLNVSRIERGVFNVSTEATDWQAMVKQLVDELTLRATSKQITLRLTPPPTPLPKVSTDKLRIGEVLSNLISNAISYTSPGGSVTVWFEVKEPEVITHVSDTGEGIPREALPHLFTKFYRVPGNKLSMGSKGTGLGLYISKSIIDMHKGRIWVDSQVGKGTTFSFSLPIALDAPLAKPVSQPPVIAQM